VAEPRFPRELYSGRSEARRFVVEGYAFFALIHAHAGLVVAGVAPRWSLPLLLPIWMARMMIGRHELLHLRKETQVDAFTRLWPVLAMITPLSVGYREYRMQHRLHHAYAVTPDDPDWYQLRGSFAQGLWHVFTSPEQDVFRWVARHRLDRRLALEITARAALFAAIAWALGPAFLWYWLPLRLTYGASLFLFSYGLHRRGARFGTFRIALGPLATRAITLLVGRAAWMAVANHDLHHADARLAAHRLDEARGHAASA
jgi:hypothetical protein